MPVTISVSDSFDGGNVKFIKQKPNDNNPEMIDVYVRIRPDVYTELENIIHMEYFSFRIMIGGLDEEAARERPQKIKYIVENAHAVSYPEAWPGTTVCYSYDVEDVDSWKRNRNTFYTEGKLWWEHEHRENGPMFFSYFAPYSYARHLKLISKCAKAPSAYVMTLGKSLQDREIECIKTGTGPLTAWIIHRQHPGETMAEHYAEGLLTRLLGLDDAPNYKLDDVVEKAKKEFTFYIVPCMCIDGAVLGHLRTNSVGANLNREWADKNFYEAPSLDRSPEVYYTLEKMKETGVDFFLDVHGDEELPYNFTSACAGIPNWGPRLQSLHGAFTAAYSRVNPDMQKKIGYPPPDDPEQVKKYLNIANNQVGYRFDCLSVTLEMPFKDCRSNPDPEVGWSAARSRKLGASVLEAMMYMQPYLRAEGEFWHALPPEDAYVETTDDYEEEDHEDDGRFKMLKKRFYSDVHEVRKPMSSLSAINES